MKEQQQSQEERIPKQHKPYAQPELTRLGTVEELTEGYLRGAARTVVGKTNLQISGIP